MGFSMFFIQLNVRNIDLGHRLCNIPPVPVLFEKFCDVYIFQNMAALLNTGMHIAYMYLLILYPLILREHL